MLPKIYSCSMIISFTNITIFLLVLNTVYPKKYAHGFCFAVLCCGYILTDFPISIRLTSLALWQSNDCPSASKATLMNLDKYFMWIHYERLHNHNKAKHHKTVCIFLGIYCMLGRIDLLKSQRHTELRGSDVLWRGSLHFVNTSRPIQNSCHFVNDFVNFVLFSV